MITFSVNSPLKTHSHEFFYSKKPLWNGCAITYVLGSYCISFLLLLSVNIGLNLFGVGLLTHSLVISAYLTHEFMHGTIFTNMRLNAVGGNIMLWLNGGCYARFKDLAREHISHHVNKVDATAFNLPEFINSLSIFPRSIILGLEWLYFPAIAFILRFYAIFSSLKQAEYYHERQRIIGILIIRGILFAVLGSYSIKSLIFYLFAYVGMINVLRFMDAFQHTYEVFTLGSVLPKQDSSYEQKNTFSMLVSQKYWWLNLLFLNFGYHNAHHAVMRCPWYHLHRLDQALQVNGLTYHLSLLKLLSNYHRFRIQRIFWGQGKVDREQDQLNINQFYGAIGVSFLVKS